MTKNNCLLTILTPTYNRRSYLPKLYTSLCNQTDFRFQWLIIDDGSTDGTNDYIGSLPRQDFAIDYHKKENGGKHTALNYSHPFIKGSLVCIVDSDDYLLPHAVHSILEEWQKYQGDPTIGGMSFIKQTPSGVSLSAPLPKNPYISDHISYRINKRVAGDRCEVIRTELFKNCIFPVFKGERFISEGKLWIESARQYKTVYQDKALYVGNYLDGGLSKSGRLLRLKNPFGMMEDCKVYFIPEVNFLVQTKEMWLYWVYGLCAGLSPAQIAARSQRSTRMWLNFPFGLTLYLYWKNKYYH